MTELNFDTKAVIEVLNEILETELGISPAAETIALYERIRSDKLKQADPYAPAPVTPLLSSTPVRQHNLPPQTTPFVGREDELARLAGLLADPELCLVTTRGRQSWQGVTLMQS